MLATGMRTTSTTTLEQKNLNLSKIIKLSSKHSDWIPYGGMIR
jgi:hypothetical protein